MGVGAGVVRDDGRVREEGVAERAQAGEGLQHLGADAVEHAAAVLLDEMRVARVGVLVVRPGERDAAPLCSAEGDAALGQVVNLANGKEISVGELAKKVLRAVGRELPIVTETQRMRPGASEVERLNAALRSLVRAARREAALPPDKRNPRCQRELFQFIRPWLSQGRA